MPRSLDRRVHQIAHQRAGIDALSRRLRHEDGEQIFFRIDPEEGAAHAAPEELADRTRKRRDAFARADAEAETKAVAGLRERTLDLDRWIEVIGGHPLQRLPPDDPCSIELAAVEQHLRETRIVHRGG